MDNYTLIIVDDLFGITQDGVEIIPPTHDTKESAVEEFVYFSTLNTNALPHRRFLNKLHTIEEINEISKNLLL